MVGDTARDLLAAADAGCEPHLVRSGRAAALPAEALKALQAQVSGARVHDSLGAFVDHLLRRDHQPDSGIGALNPLGS
jgi:D-glycero-D-manno-heptose 1,7-bisphosphate phosphatase